MRRLAFAVVFVTTLLVPALADAQASISGLVRDASGAVLPGVTVEASSPALIEKVRVATTDGAGLYSIVSLPAGTYTVTFTLSQFAPLKRDGIVLTGAFGAEVNAELRVGGIEQALTVRASTPVVDVRNTLQEQVLTKDELERLPGARTLRGRAALVPGVVVPNNLSTGVSAHGSDLEDANTRVDGYRSGGFLDGRGAGQLGIASANQTP